MSMLESRSAENVGAAMSGVAIGKRALAYLLQALELNLAYSIIQVPHAMMKSY
jgi:hypothetical protein